MSRMRLRLRVAAAWAVLPAVLLLGGCAGLAGREPAEQPKRPRPVASRAQLIAMLQENMNRLATLTAKADVQIINQNVLVPATTADALRRKVGRKRYRKAFERARVDGLLLLSREPKGDRYVRFSGQLPVGSATFSLLARNDKFWIALPNPDREAARTDGRRGTVYIGTAPRDGIRPPKTFSYRPQDIGNLFLYDEVFAPELIAYLETWKDYYILNFLRQDWREHIYSKIWINRETGRVAIHQLFGPSGEIVAEGRFGAYRPCPSQAGKTEVDIPREVVFLWPRDNLVMKVDIEHVKVNEAISPRRFEPVIPPGYKPVELKLTEETGE